jgi:hypothetical protein
MSHLNQFGSASVDAVGKMFQERGETIATPISHDSSSSRGGFNRTKDL